MGLRPPLGGQGPPTKISLFSILRFFVANDFRFKSSIARVSCVLSSEGFFKKIVNFFCEIWRFEFLGGVALFQSTVLVAPPGVNLLPHILGLDKVL